MVSFAALRARTSGHRMLVFMKPFLEEQSIFLAASCGRRTTAGQCWGSLLKGKGTGCCMAPGETLEGSQHPRQWARQGCSWGVS